jgi:molybdate transport system regulatory protein
MNPPSKLSLQTSARNCLAGRMVHIRCEGIYDEIELQLAGGDRIVCLITSDRALKLRLQAGAPAYALVNPSAVIVMTEQADAFRFSARNQLAGHVTQVQAGMENTEVTITLQGGNSLVALISNVSAGELQLTAGKPVRAIFKATSVVLGVAA